MLLELHQRLPMFDVKLFRNPTFAGANVVALLVSLAMFGVFFFISLFMQNILGYSAVRAGAAFLPMTLLIIVVAPLAGRASDRLGSRWLMTGGLALLGCSLLVFAQLQPDSSYLALLPAMILGGIGMAVTMTPMTAAALSAVPVDKAGVGSGMLNTFRQVGGALGIAVMGAILASGSQSALADGANPVDAFMNGLHHALYVAAVIAFTGSLVAAVTIRSHARRRPEAAAPVERYPRPSREPARRRTSAGGRAALGDRRGRARGLPKRQLRRLDDGRDRPRRRRLRADHLPALPVQARPLVCLRRARPGCSCRRRSSARRRSSGGTAPWTRSPATARRGPTRSCRRSGSRALTEAAEDEEIQRFLRAHVREVHDYVAAGSRACRSRARSPPDRDPGAEAWVLLGGGLLRSFADRLGGVVRPAELAAIGRERRRWLTGT